MEVVSVKVDKRLREKMKKLAHINWSEVIRNALASKIEEEEAKQRTIDSAMLQEAANLASALRKNKSMTTGWKSTEEIRRWRETRR